jgi:uncharacterized transporter YbjL
MVVHSGAAAGQPAAAPPPDKEKIDWLYSLLTILDAKAGALLAFDGLLLAAASLMYDKIGEKVEILRVPALLLIVVALFAALLCLYVARMSYPFLGAITLGQQSNAAEIAGLETAVERRTELAGYAWLLSVVTVVFFIVLVLAAIATTAR